MTHNCIEGVMITSGYRKTGAKDKVAPMRGPREKPKAKEAHRGNNEDIYAVLLT
jgi:hypothetical protein